MLQIILKTLIKKYMLWTEAILAFCLSNLYMKFGRTVKYKGKKEEEV